jgi:hypothetical protein
LNARSFACRSGARSGLIRPPKGIPPIPLRPLLPPESRRCRSRTLIALIIATSQGDRARSLLQLLRAPRRVKLPRADDDVPALARCGITFGALDASARSANPSRLYRCLNLWTLRPRDAVLAAQVDGTLLRAPWQMPPMCPVYFATYVPGLLPRSLARRRNSVRRCSDLIRKVGAPGSRGDQITRDRQTDTRRRNSRCPAELPKSG